MDAKPPCSIRLEISYARCTAATAANPSDMAAPEVEDFLTHLAADRLVSATTRNQALATMLFMHKGANAVQGPADQ